MAYPKESGWLMVQEVKEKRDPDVAKHQAKIRIDLIRTMVGTLYPVILWGEVAELNALASEFRKPSHED